MLARMYFRDLQKQGYFVGNEHNTVVYFAQRVRDYER